MRQIKIIFFALLSWSFLMAFYLGIIFLLTENIIYDNGLYVFYKEIDYTNLGFILIALAFLLVSFLASILSFKKEKSIQEQAVELIENFLLEVKAGRFKEAFNYSSNVFRHLNVSDPDKRTFFEFLIQNKYFTIKEFEQLNRG